MTRSRKFFGTARMQVTYLRRKGVKLIKYLKMCECSFCDTFTYHNFQLNSFYSYLSYFCNFNSEIQIQIFSSRIKTDFAETRNTRRKLIVIFEAIRQTSKVSFQKTTKNHSVGLGHVIFFKYFSIKCEIDMLY